MPCELDVSCPRTTLHRMSMVRRYLRGSAQIGRQSGSP